MLPDRFGLKYKTATQFDKHTNRNEEELKQRDELDDGKRLGGILLILITFKIKSITLGKDHSGKVLQDQL